jgi:uncharacterized protein (TIGR03067 family)
MKLHCATVLTVGVLFCTATAQEKGKSDHDLIQGTWNVVEALDGGRKPPPGELDGVVVIITKDQIILAKGEMKKDAIAFKLDPSKTPKWIDLTEKRGDKEQTLRGIYELKGDDLKICFNEKAGGERSTKFESVKDSPNDVLIVLKRAKK